MARVALVTGGTRGIGAAISRMLKLRGYQVAANYAGNDVAAHAFKEETGIAVYKFDVSNFDAVKAAVAQIEKDLGPIEIVVNNAGITQDARLQKMTLEQFDRVIDVNLRGVFHCSQAVADAMVAQGSGVILNASSVVGVYGNFGQTNYAASKFGVIGFTKTWSRELGPKGVRVNAVAPGFVQTPILSTMPDKVIEGMAERVPLKRLGQPEEIANVYAFLASDEASYVNGAVLEVSGGMTV